MAQPANTFSSYDAIGIQEDLSDRIYDVSPEDTPFYSTAPKAKAANRSHEWQTDALRAAADNAHIEGDDTTAVARGATTRLNNQTQIFKDAVIIPDTDEALDKAGRAGEMAYQIMKVAKEQKLDIERAAFLNSPKNAGSDVLARRMAGVPAWVKTNVTGIGAGGANPVGDGSNARTDGTAAAFTQTKFDACMQLIWEAGGKPDTVYLSAGQMNLALGFVGNNNQRSNVDLSENKVARHMVVYITPWGTVTWTMSRLCRARDVWIMQKDMWEFSMLRATKNTPLAKTGDSEKRQVVTELTLACRNEKASGGVVDNT